MTQINKLKQGDPDQNAWGDHSLKPVSPVYIMVPCDYTFLESPSDLTVKTDYVLFLRSFGSNIYHPVDPASPHVIYEQRVRLFGDESAARRREEIQKGLTPLG